MDGGSQHCTACSVWYKSSVQSTLHRLEVQCKWFPSLIPSNCCKQLKLKCDNHNHVCSGRRNLQTKHGLKTVLRGGVEEPLELRDNMLTWQTTQKNLKSHTLASTPNTQQLQFAACIHTYKYKKTDEEIIQMWLLLSNRDEGMIEWTN
jgi:hypothetical protein